MSITKRLETALQNNTLSDDNIQSIEKCIKFVEEMKRLGVLRPDQQTTSIMKENGLEQLKQLAISSPFK